jgi:hypothetical protein
MSSVGVGRAGFFVVRGGRSGRAALVERGRVEALEGLRQQRPGPGIDALVLAVDPLEGPQERSPIAASETLERGDVTQRIPALTQRES